MFQTRHVLVVRDQELVEPIVVHRIRRHLDSLILLQTARVRHTGGCHRVLRRVLHDSVWDHTDARYLMSGRR